MPGARSSKRVIFGGKLLDVVSSDPVGAPADGVAPLYENGGADGGAVDSIVGAQGPRDIEEIVAPISTRARGQVRVYPATITRRDFQLDAVGRHRWWLIAPMARVEVACKRPDLRTSTGYLDTNSGSEPPEQGFGRWDWSRTDLRDKTTILYHAQSRSGKETSLARRIDRPAPHYPAAQPNLAHRARHPSRAGMLGAHRPHPGRHATLCTLRYPDTVARTRDTLDP